MTGADRSRARGRNAGRLSGASAVAACAVGCHLFQPPDASPPRPLEPTPARPAPESVELPPVESSAPPAEEPVPSEAAIQQSGGPTRGKLSKASVERTVTASLPAFRACHEAALARAPDLTGTVLVNFVVAPDGSVPYAAALQQGTTLADDAAVDCVLGEFQKLKFDAPMGGRAVSTYPLDFAPKPSP
jgi:hypothetical protein